MPGKVTPLYAGIVIALVTIAIGMRAAGLNEHVGFGYDEGVYWQTLRAMSAGYHLYGQIFFFAAALLSAVDIPVLRAVGFHDCIGTCRRGGTFLARPSRVHI